jgi:thioredoxin reductase (NADPH)
VSEILGTSKVEGVRLLVNGKEEKQLKVDGVFIAIGHKPDTDVFKGQIELDEKGYIITKDRLAFDFLTLNKIAPEKLDHIRSETYHYGSATSVSGIFAGGDCVDYKYRQAATAVGMGVVSALEVEKYLEITS